MTTYLIDTVERLEGPGVKLWTYKIEADTPDDAMAKFISEGGETFYEGVETEAVIVGIEEANPEMLG